MPLPSIPEYSSSIRHPELIRPSLLTGGHPIEKGVRLIMYAGGFCVVYPYQTKTKKYAIRCWHAEIKDAKRRTQLIAKALKEANLPYFVGFEYFENGIETTQGVQPIVVMDWVDADPLKKYIAKHISEPNRINEVAENFKLMVADLHRNHISHGDLQHGNILVKPDGKLILVDYDSMCVPALSGFEDEVKGLQGYQHPSRWDNKYVTEKADYFSELVIYISLKALKNNPQLWNELNLEDTETLLFSGEDIKSKGQSSIFKQLKNDKEISPWVDKLCEFMSKSSLNDLCPLEEAIISLTKIISDIWKGGNGYDQSKEKEKKRDKIIESISEKFKK